MYLFILDMGLSYCLYDYASRNLILVMLYESM